MASVEGQHQEVGNWACVWASALESRVSLVKGETVVMARGLLAITAAALLLALQVAGQQPDSECGECDRLVQYSESVYRQHCYIFPLSSDYGIVLLPFFPGLCVLSLAPHPRRVLFIKRYSFVKFR